MNFMSSWGPDPALVKAIVREGGLAHMMKRMGRFLALLSEHVLEGEKVKESLSEASTADDVIAANACQFDIRQDVASRTARLHPNVIE
jgi:hypothetical protein